MRIPLWKSLVAVCISIVVILVLYFGLPAKRAGISSELVMLGDLVRDNRWDGNDAKALAEFIKHPFSFSNLDALKVDVGLDPKKRTRS